MNFKREKDAERTSLAMDRDNVYSAISAFISAAIPMNNKLKNKTDTELTELYPNKVAACIAVRDWLAANAVGLKATLEELQALLEE